MFGKAEIRPDLAYQQDEEHSPLMNTNRDKNMTKTNALKGSNVTDLVLVALVAEVGIDKYEVIRDRMLNNVTWTMGARLGLSSVLEHASTLASELVPDGEFKIGHTRRSSAFIQALSKEDLSFINGEDECVPFNSRDLMTTVMLRNAKVGELQEALDFLADHISVRAAEDARHGLRIFSDSLSSSDEGFVEQLRRSMDPDLKGPTRREEERRAVKLQGGGLSPMLAMLLGLGGDALQEEKHVNEKKEPTLGDLWRMQGFSSGMPSDIESYLRINDPKGEVMNMAGVRGTSLRIMAAENTETILGAISKVFGSEMPKHIFRLAQDGIFRDFGSVEKAEEVLVLWLAERGELRVEPTGLDDGKFQIPTPGCECRGCDLVRVAARSGMRFDRKTGETVKTQPTEL